MPARFGRRPFLHSWVHLFTEWQNDHNDVADTSSASLTSEKSASFDTIIVEWPQLDAAWLNTWWIASLDSERERQTGTANESETNWLRSGGDVASSNGQNWGGLSELRPAVR